MPGRKRRSRQSPEKRKSTAKRCQPCKQYSSTRPTTPTHAHAGCFVREGVRISIWRKSIVQRRNEIQIECPGKTMANDSLSSTNEKLYYSSACLPDVIRTIFTSTTVLQYAAKFIRKKPRRRPLKLTGAKPRQILESEIAWRGNMQYKNEHFIEGASGITVIAICSVANSRCLRALIRGKVPPLSLWCASFSPWR